MLYKSDSIKITNTKNEHHQIPIKQLINPFSKVIQQYISNRIKYVYSLILLLKAYLKNYDDDITYTWNLKYNTNEPVYKRETDSQT